MDLWVLLFFFFFQISNRFNFNFHLFLEPNRLGLSQLSRFVNWVHLDDFGCRGKWQRLICIFSIGDLPLVVNQPHLIANKFSLEFDPIAYQCMEEWLEEKVVEKPTINMFDYCQLKTKYSDFANCPRYSNA